MSSSKLEWETKRCFKVECWHLEPQFYHAAVSTRGNNWNEWQPKFTKKKKTSINFEEESEPNTKKSWRCEFLKPYNIIYHFIFLSLEAPQLSLSPIHPFARNTTFARFMDGNVSLFLPSPCRAPLAVWSPGNRPRSCVEAVFTAHCKMEREEGRKKKKRSTVALSSCRCRL